MRTYLYGLLLDLDLSVVFHLTEGWVITYAFLPVHQRTLPLQTRYQSEGASMTYEEKRRNRSYPRQPQPRSTPIRPRTSASISQMMQYKRKVCEACDLHSKQYILTCDPHPVSHPDRPARFNMSQVDLLHDGGRCRLSTFFDPYSSASRTNRDL